MVSGGGGTGTGGTTHIILPTGGSAGVGAGPMGPYMLPPDFTKATLGGFKLGDPIAGDPTAGGGASSGGASGCGTQILGVLRDFNGKDDPNGHPDFEAFSGTSASLGIVAQSLGADQKPVYGPAGGGPLTDPQNGQQTTSKARFDQWYRYTADVNKPYIVYFSFEPNNGVLTFQSNAFFPLDGQGWGNQGRPHNFHFTTEVHTSFTYNGGETFSFTGDDDLWVFINNQLALDLGGLHPQLNKSISLDALKSKLGISVGSVYPLDLFHAERHTDQSNFRVDTDLAFTNCGVVVSDGPK